MPYIVYSDFTTAESYALNEQIVTLGLSAAVEWRGVQLDPGLPSPMRVLDRRAVAQLEEDIAGVQRRAPGIEIAQPRGKPNTSRAIVAVASVVRAHPAKAAAFRDELFRTYWRAGADLSVAEEVQRVADLVGVPRFVALDHPDAVELAARWELDWAVERLGGVPRVVRRDGTVLWGLRAPGEAAAFFGVASPG